MKHSQNNNKGFSLVEVLIAVAVLTIVITPIAMTFISSSKVNQKAKRVLSATEMAQNLFEGISAKKPEDAIIELSGLAYSDKLDLKEKASVLPLNNGYDSVKEYRVTYNATDDEYEYFDQTSGGYIQSIVYDDVADEYRCRGMAESTSGIYGFGILGIKQVDTYYDLRVTLDSSNYDSTYVSEDVGYEQLVNISGINSNYDSVYLDKVSNLENTVALEYQNKKLTSSAGTASNILSNLQRTYVIDISDDGLAVDPNIYVDVSTEYEYLRSSDKAFNETLTLTPQAERIYESTTAPRNIFIYYVPNYYSTNAGSPLDQFVINNQKEYNVNVYLIRTKQERSSVFNDDNVTISSREKSYAASVDINEKSGAAIETTIRSNLEDNISKDYNDRKVDATNKISYQIHVNDSVRSQAELASMLDLQTVSVEAEKAEKRKYDVTIEVYPGKSGGKGDHNAYVGYAGAGANSFPKESRLAVFTGSIVQ